MVQKRKSNSKKFKIFLWIFLVIIVVLILTPVVWFFTLPDVSKLNGSIKVERQIKKGDSYVSIPFVVGEKNKDFVPLKEISPDLIHAVIVAEDIEFYSHSGFNFREIGESIKKNFKKLDVVRGGSTITQQLMKNIYLSGTKSITRKVKEAILTYKAESVLSKNRILELYLNIIEWGDGIYGIKDASWYYFKKGSGSLTPEDSAFLAALIPAPKRYSKSNNNPKLVSYLKRRENTILWWMEKAGYLAPRDASREREEKRVEKEAKQEKQSARKKLLSKKSPLTKSTPEPKKEETKAIAKKDLKLEPRPNVSDEDDEDVFKMVEDFQPQEVFKQKQAEASKSPTP